MRKDYLDNIRTFIILLLFPIHTFMVWNSFGSKFYVWRGNNRLVSSVIVFFNPWMMAVLFLIAGMSMRYSLEKRSKKEYLKERVNKLLVPFISGLLLLNPLMTLISRKYFFGYEGGIGENFKYFLTNFSDLTGYDGAFTPGHLWFIIFLFIVALISLLVVKYLPYKSVAKKLKKMNLFMIILLFIPVYLFYHIGNFGGKSVGQALFLFLLGYYLFDDDFMEKISKYKFIVIALFLFFQLLLVFLYYKFSFYGDLLVMFVCWLGTLSSMVIGYNFLNKTNKIAGYCLRASFPIYILHLPILVAVSYYVLGYFNNIFLQILIILLGSFCLTIISYEIVRRIPFLRKLIGIR